MVKLAVPREVRPGETRVALVPQVIPGLIKRGYEVLIEQGAGLASGFTDDQYRDAGARVVASPEEIWQGGDVICKVTPPTEHPELKRAEAELLAEGKTYVGFLAPLEEHEVLRVFLQRKITGFAMEFIPRITRAQPMDALSSQANLAGYKAVIMAADRLRKIFPLLMTAAGTITPAQVFVLGAGVAGLQAIATAKRLGAKVMAFDPRPAVKEQVQSLGATFVEMEVPQEDVETAGGYAKAQSDAFLKAEQEAIAAVLPKTDVVITTAQIFGKRAPILITAEMVEQMPSGGVIVDLAAQQGGNCELTKPGEIIEHEGVTIIGSLNLPALLPVNASQMYARNIVSFVRQVLPADSQGLDFEDEITKGACITYQGEIKNELVAKAFQK